jgi:hypothetical protein
MLEYEGPDRRTCIVPCKPISDKLDIIEECSRKKVPMKLFLVLIAVLVVPIGGMQWKIVDSVGTIDKNVAVLAVAVTETRSDLTMHDNERHKIDKRVRDLELRESSRHPEYFNWKQEGE